jgi:hypothetical protein
MTLRANKYRISTTLRMLFIGVFLLALAIFSSNIGASPNGTRPTMLSNLAVVSVNSTSMRVSGNFTTTSGFGISGMPVKIYAVGEAYFTLWYTVYPGNNGGFSATMTKPPQNTKIQIEVEGNGAYSRPFPTFNRP